MGLKLSRGPFLVRIMVQLKSDQNGIEIFSFRQEFSCFRSLKSDQNGIEIIYLFLKFCRHIQLKSDQNGIEMGGGREG